MTDQRYKKYLLYILKLTVLAALLCCSSALAVDRDELRLKAGLDLFPSLLAADLDIAEKKSGEGFLTLLLVYTDNRAGANEIAKSLKALKEIRGIPVNVEITNNLSADHLKGFAPAGVFLAQPLGDQLSGVIDFAVKNKVILFSPFKGDVEKGVLGGLHISDRLLPFINVSSMKSSGIRIKKFFMRVSITYEK